MVNFYGEKAPSLVPLNKQEHVISSLRPWRWLFHLQVKSIWTLSDKSDLLLLKIDENAEPLWWRNFGTTNIEWATDLLMSSGSTIALGKQSSEATYNLQAVLVPTDMNGNIVVGLEQIPQIPLSDVTVFPNPANHGIHIDISNILNTKVSWLLSDLTGRQVHQGISPGRAFDINPRSYPTACAY